MLTPPDGRQEARPAPPRPVTPAPSAPVQAPAEEPEEATDWYQPAVASAMPYEFPSTGSVRLIPQPGRGTGGRPAPRPSTAATTGRAAVSPTPPGPVRPASGPAALAAPGPAARAASGPAVPAASGPATPAASGSAARAASGPAAPAASGPGTRAASGPAAHAASGAAPAASGPAAAAASGPAAAAADAAAERAAPRYVIPGPPGPSPTAATDRAATAPAPSGGATAAPATADRAAPASTADRAGTSPAAVPRPAGSDLFSRHTRSYAAENSGQQITILQAGCTTAEDLDTGPLRAAGVRLSVSMIDEDTEVTRAAVAQHESMRGAILGELRAAPLPPRAYDIVQCSSLLDRIEHADVVLDRLCAAVKPGGLLLLRIRDRDSAAGFLDRVLPGPLRRVIWRTRQPGEPGPHTAVYEVLASGRGVHAYVLAHGLVIAERGALGGLTGGLGGEPYGYLAAQKLVAWLSRGRLTSAHEDLLYVIRKPEDRFARLI